MLPGRGSVGVTVADPVQANFLSPIQRILGGRMPKGESDLGLDRDDQLGDRFARLSRLLGDPTWKPGEKELGLRDLTYGQVESAYGDNTDFLNTAYGRLLQSQTAEATNAGIRDYLSRTGGAGTAAAAATAASLRSRGATDLARTGLAARDQQQSRVGQLLDFLQGSLSREARGREAGYGARAGLLGQLLNQDQALQLAKEHQKSAAIGALGGWASNFGAGLGSAMTGNRQLALQERLQRFREGQYEDERNDQAREQWLNRFGNESRELGGGGPLLGGAKQPGPWREPDLSYDGLNDLLRKLGASRV